jgi:hypothetical protein
MDAQTMEDNPRKGKTKETQTQTGQTSAVREGQGELRLNAPESL